MRVILPLLDLDQSVRQDPIPGVGFIVDHLVELFPGERRRGFGVRVTFEHERLLVGRQLRLSAFVFPRQIGTPLNRVVNGKVRQVEEERAVAVLINELECFIGKPVGQVITLCAGEPLKFERIVITRFRPTLEPILRDLDIKALPQRAGLLFPQVPFSQNALSDSHGI